MSVLFATCFRYYTIEYMDHGIGTMQCLSTCWYVLSNDLIADVVEAHATEYIEPERY